MTAFVWSTYCFLARQPSGYGRRPSESARADRGAWPTACRSPRAVHGSLDLGMHSRSGGLRLETLRREAGELPVDRDVAGLRQELQCHARCLRRHAGDCGYVADVRLASPRTRTKFAVSGSDSSDVALEVERVGEEHLREERRQVGSGRRARRGARFLRRMPFELPTMGRHSGSSTSSLSVTGPSASAELADRGRAEPLLPTLLDLVEQRRSDLLHLLSHRRGADVPLGSQRPRAAPAFALGLRSSTGRLGLTNTYRQRSIPPSVESVRDFGIPAASGSSPTVMCRPTNRMKFDHITIEMGSRRPTSASASRWSNSLSYSIVNATSSWDSGVESGRAGTRAMLRHALSLDPLL